MINKKINTNASQDHSDKINFNNQDNNRSYSRYNKNSEGNEAKKKEFIDCVVEIKRVTKVTKGGKTFKFSAFVVSGDSNGRIGMGKGVGKDISVAVAKATIRARKFLFSIAKKDTTIPFKVYGKHGASSVMLEPAYKGSGLIAGGSMRFVLKAAGIQDIVAKSIGTSRSGANLVKATLNALSHCRSIEEIATLRGKTKKQIILGCHHES
jgi:small subunit ribosomal protein S5